LAICVQEVSGKVSNPRLNLPFPGPRDLEPKRKVNVEDGTPRSVTVQRAVARVNDEEENSRAGGGDI
jgi:hypothetical protein